MGRLLWSADIHFNHANIINYCHRPFKTVDQMNKVLIHNWNMRVKPEDTVIHNGDFCFKEGEGRHKPSFFRSQLNGNIVFVRGNHDNNNSLATYINSMVVEFGGQKMFVVHNPNDFNPVYPVNIVGHIHQSWKSRVLFQGTKHPVVLINVGVDVWNFMPITYEEIFKEINRAKGLLGIK